MPEISEISNRGASLAEARLSAPTREMHVDSSASHTEGKLTEKHAQSRNSLPDELKPTFDALVAEYKYLAFLHHRAPFVSYLVLADLVRNGWRPSPEERNSQTTKK